MPSSHSLSALRSVHCSFNYVRVGCLLLLLRRKEASGLGTPLECKYEVQNLKKKIQKIKDEKQAVLSVENFRFSLVIAKPIGAVRKN